MIPVTGCKLFGAYRAVNSVKDAAVLIHSTIGCSWGTMAFHIPSRLNRVRQASSVLYGDDVVFGGAKALQKALANMLKSYDSAVIFVVTGCVAEIMDDDVESVIAEFAADRPIIPIKAAGFKGDMQSGFLDAFKVLVNCMDGNAARRAKSINLIGVFADDYKTDADLAAIRQLLGPEIKINAVLPYDTLAAVKNAPAAALNVVFRGFEPVGEYMEEAFGTPYVVTEYPYGLAGSCSFAKRIADAFSIPTNLRFQERQYMRKMESAFDYLHKFYGLPVAIGGDSVRAHSLKVFLEREVGMDVEVFQPYTQDGNADFSKQVEQSNAVLLYGSSFDRELAETLQIPLLRYTYPVFDSICISPRPYAGFAGAINWLEDMINACMTMEYRRTGLYDIATGKSGDLGR